MIRGLCHLLVDAVRTRSLRAASPPLWQIYRLLDRPRWASGVIRIGRRTVHYIDSRSTFYQWVDIFRDGVFDFDDGSDSPLIVDAGANVGLATLYWQTRFARPEIIAVEPCALAYASLVRNVGSHPTTRLLQKALWSVAGPIPFQEQADDSSHIERSDDAGQSGTVDAITLGSILADCDRDIDFLKIDIEGAEVEVLREARSFLPRVRRLSVEYHQWPSGEQRLSELLGLIEDAGYRYVVDARRRVPRTFDRITDTTALSFTANIYAERTAEA